MLIKGEKHCLRDLGFKIEPFVFLLLIAMRGHTNLKVQALKVDCRKVD